MAMSTSNGSIYFATSSYCTGLGKDDSSLTFFHLYVKQSLYNLITPVKVFLLTILNFKTSLMEGDGKESQFINHSDPSAVYLTSNESPPPPYPAVTKHHCETRQVCESIVIA
jgi:hypothetical protein